MISIKSVINDAILSLLNDSRYSDRMAGDLLSFNPAYVAIRFDTHFDAHFDSVGFGITDEQGKGEQGYWSVLDGADSTAPGVVLSEEQREYMTRFGRRNPHVTKFIYKFENDDVLSMAKFLVL